MYRLLDTPRRRSLAGFIAALLFIPLMLGITACLETPIGDPERGWVDPRVTGAWLYAQAEPAGAQLWLFEPYDGRTWLVTVVGFEEPAQDSDTPDQQPDPAAPEDAGPGDEATVEATPTVPTAPLQARDLSDLLGVLGTDRLKATGRWVFKAWNTSIAGRRFLVLEPKATLDVEAGFDPQFWIVYRMVLKGGQMELAMVDVNTDHLGSAQTRGEAEQIIARHAADPDFYDETATLQHVPREAYGELSDALERAGFSQW
jgi:hypothetical protein